MVDSFFWGGGEITRSAAHLNVEMRPGWSQELGSQVLEYRTWAVGELHDLALPTASRLVFPASPALVTRSTLMYSLVHGTCPSVVPLQAPFSLRALPTLCLPFFPTLAAPSPPLSPAPRISGNACRMTAR